MLSKPGFNKNGNLAMGSSNIASNGDIPPDVIKSGYLKKLKTMKKKFFVLRSESDLGPARIEYYDNEKKWRLALGNGTGVAKRSIILKTCFNINKKVDSKQKHAVAMYTRDDCFAIAMETEAEQEEWLTLLLALQQGHTDSSGNLTFPDRDSKPKPNFEHVWQVTVKSKGLGSSKSIAGPHRLCLTSMTLSLVKMNADSESFEFPLMSIRRCGHSDCFFFMELGRSACTGAGELWMQTEDTVIAQNMHEAILGAMKSSRSHEDLGPLARPRSSSTSENSKMIATRPVAVVNPVMSVSNSSVSSLSNMSMSNVSMDRGSTSQTMSAAGPRDRCDSMPTRSRTVSEGHHDLPTRTSYYFEMSRPHSSYNHSMSYSPPVTNNPLSPSSGAYSDSAGSSLSIDDYDSPSDYHHRYLGHPSECTVHTEPTITEEGNDDYQSMTPEAIDMIDSGVVMDSTPKSTPSSNDYLDMHPCVTKPNQRSSLTTMFLNLNTGMDSSSSHVPVIHNKPGHPNNVIGRLSGNVHPDSRNSASASSGYIEMTSPSTPSLPDSITDGYIPMSPGGPVNINQRSHKLTTGSLDSDTQPGFGSLDWNDAYMSMYPSEESRSTSSQHQHDGTNDGYLDMRTQSSSLPKFGYSMMGSANLSSPSHSTNSLQDMSYSCSPADMEGFHLDKVKSFFTPSEEDSDDYIKPVRAYSIGSRPQIRKTHLGSHLEQCRVRAYSFGSQVHNSSNRNTAGGHGYNTNTMDTELGAMRNLDSRVSKKSSSAPLLPSRAHTAMIGHAPTNSGARVVRPCNSSTRNDDDLMEIVYQQPSPTGSTFSRVKSQESSDGEHFRRYSAGSRSRTNSRSSAAGPNLPHTKKESSGIFDTSKHNEAMKQISHNETSLHRGASLDSSKYMELSSRPKEQTSRHVAHGSNDYMEMSPETATPPSETAKKTKDNSKSFLKASLESQPNQTEIALPSPKNISGDYVNLDLTRATWQLDYLAASGAKKPTNSVPEAPIVHDYMNLSPVILESKVEQPAHIVAQASYSDYAVMSPVDIPDKVLVEVKTLKVGKAGDSLSEVRTNGELGCIKKQHSAPSVPALANEPKFPSRKSSCPISSSIAKPPDSPNISSLKSPAGSVQSLDRSSVSSLPEELSESSTITEFSDHRGGSPTVVTKNGDSAYENIQIRSSSGLLSPISRPVSVSSERELNYASLDLAPPSGAEESLRSPKLAKSLQASNYSCGAEENGNAEITDAPLSYAEIDFTKSEGLRNVSGSLREGRV